MVTQPCYFTVHRFGLLIKGLSAERISKDLNFFKTYQNKQKHSPKGKEKFSVISEKVKKN